MSCLFVCLFVCVCFSIHAVSPSILLLLRKKERKKNRDNNNQLQKNFRLLLAPAAVATPSRLNNKHTKKKMAENTPAASATAPAMSPTAFLSHLFFPRTPSASPVSGNAPALPEIVVSTTGTTPPAQSPVTRAPGTWSRQSSASADVHGLIEGGNGAHPASLTAPSSSSTAVVGGSSPSAASAAVVRTDALASPSQAAPRGGRVVPKFSHAGTELGDHTSASAEAVPAATHCSPSKMAYRQCLELNPDAKINCTWALDRLMQCQESRKDVIN